MKKTIWAGYLFFFVSGAVALVYEILWLRLLGHAFGNTTYAISTVLAAYMAGLGLGGWAVGRLADRWSRPLFAYGCLEIGIGIYAAFTLVLIQGIQQSYSAFAQAVDSTAPALLVSARLLLSSLMLFIPTFLMGATLPVLAKFYIHRRETIGSGTAALYGFNTAGAVAGTLLAGFWILPAFGTQGTLSIAVAGNVVIGVLACVLGRMGQTERHSEAPYSSAPKNPELRDPSSAYGGLRMTESSFRWILPGIFISGAIAMLYEVAWTRVLAVVLGSSTYAFTIMLATFLLGLALGSAAYKKILEKRPARVSEWAWLQIIIAASALVALPFYERIGIFTVRLFALTIDRPALLEIGRLLVCGALMLIPTFCFGAIFPVSTALYTQDTGRIGRDVGRLYLSNTAGNIAGSLAAGFLLIPLVGIHKTILAAAILGSLTGLAAFWNAWKAPAKRLAATALCGLVLAPGLWINRVGWDGRVLTSGLYIRPQGSVEKNTTEILSWLYDTETLFYREGLNCVVNVAQSGDHRFLKVNGKTDASTGLDMSTQLLSGHLPHLFHKDPRRTLIIGFGSGVTLAASLAHPVDKVDCVEIEQAVLDAAPFFDRVNRRAYRDARAKLITNDGRNHLLVHKEIYDVIISEPSNPWMSGTASLFTLEFYELARKRLAAGGVFCQWLQAYGIAPEDFRMVVASFQKVFPHVTLWQSLPGDALILASGEPLRLDLNRVEARFRDSADFRNDLARIGIRGPAGIVSYFELGPKDVNDYVKGARLHTDNDLSLEFNAPRALYAQGTAEMIFNILRSRRTENLPTLLTENWPAEKHTEAILQIGEGYLAKGGGDSLGQAKTYFKKILETDPDNPRALVGLGRTALREDKLVPAISYFEKAALQSPPSAEAYGYLGLAYLNGGGHRTALEYLKKAVELDKMNGNFYHWSAKALERLGWWKDAAEAYRLARQLNAQSLDLEIAYARSLRNSGNLEEAIEILERLREEFKTHGPIYTELRLAYEKAGNLEPAILAYEDLVKLNPYWYAYWVDLYKLYEKKGDKKGLERAKRQGLKTHPYFLNFISAS
jgi:spermidine synthase